MVMSFNPMLVKVLDFQTNGSDDSLKGPLE